MESAGRFDLMLANNRKILDFPTNIHSVTIVFATTEPEKDN